MTADEKKMYAGRKTSIPNTRTTPLNEAEIRMNEEAAFKQKMIDHISSELTIGKKYNSKYFFRPFFDINDIIHSVDKDNT